MRGVERQDGDRVVFSNVVTDLSLTLEDWTTTETAQSVHSRMVFREGEEQVVSRTAASRFTTVDGQSCRNHAVFVVASGKPTNLRFGRT